MAIFFHFQTFVAIFSCLLAASQAQVLPLAPIAGKTLVRAPAHDSASIAHHRLGGNFAYAIQTAEAFAEVTPKIAHQTIPIAEHTHVHQPAAIRTIQPAPIITKTFEASPVLAQQPVFGTEPVIGPVATEVTYKQPIYKTRTFTQTHQVAHTVAQPAVVAHAAPAIAHAVPAVAHAGLGLAHGAYAHGLAAPALAHGHYALPAGVAAVPAALPVAQ